MFIVDLVNVDEIRPGCTSDRFVRKIVGQKARNFLSLKHSNPEIQEDICLSLIYMNNAGTLDLIAPTRNIRDVWVEGLAYLLKTCKLKRKRSDLDEWLKIEFKRVDLKNNGRLNYDQTVSLLKKLCIPTDDVVKELFMV